MTTTQTSLLTIRVTGKPVSTNRMYASGRRGGRYLAPDAEAWRDLVFTETRKVVHPLRGLYIPLPMRVVCTFYRIRANADADNLLKLTLDGLKLALRIDDKHFNHVEAHISPDKTAAQGAVIEVYPGLQPIMQSKA